MAVKIFLSPVKIFDTRQLYGPSTQGTSIDSPSLREALAQLLSFKPKKFTPKQRKVPGKYKDPIQSGNAIDLLLDDDQSLCGRQYSGSSKEFQIQTLCRLSKTNAASGAVQANASLRIWRIRPLSI